HQHHHAARVDQNLRHRHKIRQCKNVQPGHGEQDPKKAKDRPRDVPADRHITGGSEHNAGQDIENSCQDVVSGLGFRLSSSMRFFSATSSGVISENLYVKAGTSVTLLSYVSVMMIHSVGHTVVHRPQYMHLAISISNRAA